MKFRGWGLVTSLVLACTSVQADNIALYTFTGSNLTAASVAGFVGASSVSLSAGTIEFGSSQPTTWTNTPNSGLPYIEESGGWTSNQQSNAKSFRFTLSNSGANFTITNISFETRSTPAGPSALGVAINGTNIYSQNITNDVTSLISIPVSGNNDLATALVAIQGYTNGTRATAGSGAFRVDTILVQGTVDVPADPPEVIITTSADTVPFATTTYDIAGTANANTVGDLTWTNALAGVGGTIAASANWNINAISLAVGTNVIVVSGSNSVGTVDSDSVNIIRQAAPPPSVVITTTNQTVVNATTTINVSGTANAETVGELSWTNALNGSAGTIAATLSWTVPNIPLAVGANVITVRGSNAFSTVASGSVTITREAPVLPVGTNVQYHQGFETSGETWDILSGAEHASNDPGATNTPANARIRTGSFSWQTIGSTNTLDLESVDISGKTDVVIRIRLASISTTTGNGADAGDTVRFFVALDGGAFGDAQTAIRGNSNARWDFNAILTADRTVSGAPANTNIASAGSSSTNYATIRLFVPNTATSVALRVTALNDSASEIWAIDDIELLSSDVATGGGDTVLDEYDVTGVTLAPGLVSVTVTVTSNGVPYSLLYTTNLTTAPVPTGTADTEVATGGPVTLQDTSTTEPQKYYWIRTND